jgi:hypothetical protein
MTLHNYINRNSQDSQYSQDNHAFVEFNRYSKFFYNEVLIDVMSRS